MKSIGYDLSSVFQQSGIAVYARELVRHMVRIEDRPDMTFVVRHKQAEKVRALIGDAERWSLRGVLPSALMLGEYGRPITQLFMDHQWRKLRKEIDLVHFHEGGRTLPPVNTSVVTVHDLFPLDPSIPCPASLRESFKRQVVVMMHHAARILTPSEYVKSEITRLFPPYADKIRVTPLAASDQFVPSTEGHPFEGQPYLLWIGRIDERKNLVRILQAWNRLPAALRTSSRLILVGPWDHHVARVEHPELASLLGGEGIELRSHLTSAEHQRLLTHAHGLIFPSIAEGFGLPVVEAMKCACPVLTSRTSSLPEVAGDAALLVDPLRVDEIASGMEQLLTSVTLRDDLRTRGIERVRRFSWDQTARNTLDVYREVLA